MDLTMAAARTEDVVEICHLEEYVDTIIGKLSKGFRQRVGVAQAIIHEPDVLILDEPTVGIDPIQVSMTRQLIRELGKNSTILLSTHILPEVSMTCERVIIIHEGKIIAEDKIENLSSMVAGSRRIRLEVTGPSKDIVKELQKIKGLTRIHYDGTHYTVEFPSDQDLRPNITGAITKNNWTLLSVESVAMSLEDVFLKLTTEEEDTEK
jgi:ABC-2 type transport system ATP-binding protein